MDASAAESSSKRRKHSKKGSSSNKKHHSSKHGNKAESIQTSINRNDNTTSLVDETINTTNDMIINDQTNSEPSQLKEFDRKRDGPLTDEEIYRLLAKDPNDTIDEIKKAKQSFVEVLEKKKLIGNYFKDLEKLQPKMHNDMNFGTTNNSKRYSFNSLDHNHFGGMHDQSGDSTHSFGMNQNILIGGDDQYDPFLDNTFSYKPTTTQAEYLNPLDTNTLQPQTFTLPTNQNDLSTKSITANDITNSNEQINDFHTMNNSMPSQFHQLSPNNSVDQFQLNDSSHSNESPQINQSNEYGNQNFSTVPISEEESDDSNPQWSENNPASAREDPPTMPRKFNYTSSQFADGNMISDKDDIQPDYTGVI